MRVDVFGWNVVQSMPYNSSGDMHFQKWLAVSGPSKIVLTSLKTFWTRKFYCLAGTFQVISADACLQRNCRTYLELHSKTSTPKICSFRVKFTSQKQQIVWKICGWPQSFCWQCILFVNIAEAEFCDIFNNSS